MKALKSARTLAASLGVLAIGAMAASPAMAFDNVEWNWQNDTKEKVDIDVDIDINVDPTGLVQVEKLQIWLGDVTATNTVSHIYNNPFYEGAGYHDDYYTPEEKKKRGRGGDEYGQGGGIGVNVALGSQGNVCSLAICINLVLQNNSLGGYGNDGYKHKDDGWDKIPVKPLDARYELPIVVGSAQAIGNNQSITSDVPVFLHDGQFLADTKSYHRDPTQCPASTVSCDNNEYADLLAGMPASTATFDGKNWNYGPEGNLHHDVALVFGLLALTGNLKHADITATSKAYDLKNVSVDNSSTAVGNNISVDLASDVDGVVTAAAGKTYEQCKDKYKCDHNNDPDGVASNHVVIADITQFGLANVTATTETKYVSATGYDHMRELTTATLSPREGDPGFTIKVPTPWVSSTATAVGNNVSINVGRDLTPTPKP